MLLLILYMEKIRISAVSYLNTKPFVYGLQHSELLNRMDLMLDIPSLCATKLSSNLADIGLIPVAAIAEVPNAQIISDYCIASSGKVRTVVMASNVPLNEIKKVLLDYHSRTSVQLVQILAKFFWKIQPEWEHAQSRNSLTDMAESTAAVIIGDRAFGIEKEFKFCYDLGEVWKQFTGLDFVFACWIANKPIDIEFVSDFNRALAHGILHIVDVAREYEKDYPDYSLNEYFSENINFVFDDSKRKGLELFLKLNSDLAG